MSDVDLRVGVFAYDTTRALLDGTVAVDGVRSTQVSTAATVPAVERDHYRRTGIFPIMHTVVARRDLLTANPGLARSVFRAFANAKDAAAEQYRRERRLYHVQHMLPWANALFEEDRQLLGDDWWPYGISANRTTLDTYLRYHHEQGLTSRRWTVEKIFAADLLDT